MTPMQIQYNKIKQQYKDAVLLFRLGDFYEAFNEDAELLSEVLGITLTGRGKGESRIPMAGIPYHALSNYVPKLVEAGIKVAIADQVEEAVQGQLVDRKVTKIITSGTITDDKSLKPGQNNFISSIFEQGDKYYVTYADITTGELQIFDTNLISDVVRELKKMEVSEVLVNKDINQILKDKLRLTLLESEYYSTRDNFEYLKNYFEVKTLKGYGINEDSAFISSIAALLKYAEETQQKRINHVTKIEKKNFSDYMQLDESTIQNLELLYPIQTSGNSDATVFSVINKTLTSMGQRLLRYWLINPLINNEKLQSRFNSVDYFVNHPIIADDVKDNLVKIYDFERLAGKIGLESANPKDITLLKESLINSINLFENLSNDNALPERLKFLSQIQNKENIESVIKIINQTLQEDPAVATSEGGYIKDGFDDKIDELRNIKNNSTKILKEIQSREATATGITTLKIGFNKVFGYFIEVTRSRVHKVPQTYIRKQTLSNAERYITEELKEIEDKILSAEEKLIHLELEKYQILLEDLKKYLADIMQIAKNIAEIDCYISFAQIARMQRFTKPELTDENILKIEEGRHIVVENLQNNFVPNTTLFDSENGIFHILTGPNMSGKSTYIRQIAVITLLAQIGSFVPAKSMKFSTVDRIFTRVGASDNLAKGESTFMLEMIETSNILNNATEKSLIILDEVGRGTSTYDGVAIAWAIIEYIVNKIKAKTLFATHYHELIELEKSKDSIKNYHVSVVEENEKIIFQYKIKKGGTDKSYGVNVAEIAGIPVEITKRANEILGKFESSDKTEKKQSKKTIQNKIQPKRIHPEQMGLL